MRTTLFTGNVLLPFLACLILMAAHGYVVAAPATTIDSVSPHQITVGKQQEITLKVSGWQPGSQITISPGGPELKHTLHLEGDVNDMAVTADYLYAASNKHGLLIIDITHIHEPILVGHWDIGNKPTKIALSGEQIFLADEDYIYSIDIQRPEDPGLIAKFPVNGPVTELLANGTHVYTLLNQKRVLVLDAANGSLKKLATLKLKGKANHIYTDQDQLYVANNDDGLAAYDISDVSSLRQTGQYRTTGPGLDVVVNDGLAYVATGNNGLTILDVNDPAHIKWVGSHQQLGNATKVIADNGHIFVADDESKLMLMDTDNPALPTIHSIYRVNGHLHGFSPHSESGHNTVYAIMDDKLLAIDFTPTSPVLSNEGLDFGQGVNFGGERRIFIRDNIAYVADWFSGIHIYDISKPAMPKLLSSFHTKGSPKGIVVRGDYAYVADDDHGVHIINIKDPRIPVLVSSLLTPGLAYTPILDGDKLYLASHRGGFQIIDISDVNNPQLISSYDTPGKSWSIQVAKNIAYVADDDTGLLVFDVSSPAEPKLIGQFNPGGNAEDVVIDNDIAYVAFFDLGVYVLDIKDPSRPVQIGHVMTPGNGRGLELKNKLLYVADWLSGIQVVDVRKSTNPHIIGSYDTRGAAWGIRIKGHYAFVADWWGGFAVLDVSDPERPKFAGTYHTRGKVKQTQVKGDYIYAANGAGGLQIFDIKNPLNPTWVTGVDLDGDADGITIEGNRAYVDLDNQSTAVIDISNPFEAKQIDTITKDHISDTRTSTTPQITVHKGIEYVSGSKTITAIKLIPEPDVKLVDDNTIMLSLPDDLPTGVYDIDITGPQDKTSSLSNAIEVSLPPFGKPAFTMEDLKKVMEKMKKNPH